MTSVPPPHGMTEVDYEAIEAAVTETVRGRWFLAEFARRNRLAETRQLLDAILRIETAVAGGQMALAAADPSIRLLIQRIKEIAAQLGDVAGEMREAGVDAHFVAAIDLQARAVAGMMRSATLQKDALPPRDVSRGSPPERGALPVAGPAITPLATSRIPADATRVPPHMPRMPRADLPPMLAEMPPAHAAVVTEPLDDPRLATLSGLDGMTLAKKLALFF